MGKRRFRAPQVRRFLICVVVTATISGLVARGFGEDVTGFVARIPATGAGFAFLGWLFGGPPVLLAAVAWNDRLRFDVEQRRFRAVFYGIWFGLGGFVVPGLVGDREAIFGTAAPTGTELAFGWACAAVGNAAAITFATGIGHVRRQAAGDGEPPESELATRFVESAWAVLLLLAMLFAVYGDRLGLR
ncbi:MAG TPA: hypothetical protein VFO98_04020 [Marmoricola sp.]|jgi:hypothetical protein|nr:hypothetical protein [Marmoricola sp.]